MSELSTLQKRCIGWAQQFASLETIVTVNDQAFDRDYGDFVDICIKPAALDKPMIGMMVLTNELGFTVETWARLQDRITQQASVNSHIKNGAQVKNFVAAFKEPAASSLDEMTKALDLISKGQFVVRANTFRGRIVGSSAVVKKLPISETVEGPSSGSQMLRAIGIGNTVYFAYVALQLEMVPLAISLGCLN
jgi:hypothetical protein